MPAYRSSAEAEIRGAVVSKLRLLVPGCRIIHEINCELGGRRTDVLAVATTRIVAVEIKSSKDKLDRLPAQVRAMSKITDDVIATIHEKFMTDDGRAYPDEAKGAKVWVYRAHSPSLGWALPRAHPQTALPVTALKMLWNSELLRICTAQRLPAGARSTKQEMIRQIAWHLGGSEIAAEVCRELRARSCAEADPPIYEVRGLGSEAWG